jgi:hypothetical protein
MCLNPQKSMLYWFRGNGMVSRIDCDTLDKEDYEVGITSKFS